MTNLPRVLGLVLKAWQFRVICPRRCICKKSFTKRSFRAGSWISEQKFTQKLVTKGKGLHSYTDRKTGECFQRKTIGCCSRRDNCSFLHTHATGRRETMWQEVGDAKRSHLEQVSSSVPKVKEPTDVKNSYSLKASPATRVKKIPCLWVTGCKRSLCNYRHHPVSRGYKSGNRCICGIRCLYRHADCEK